MVPPARAEDAGNDIFAKPRQTCFRALQSKGSQVKVLKVLMMCLVAVTLVLVAPASGHPPKQHKPYDNCKQFNAKYPHGLGGSGRATRRPARRSLTFGAAIRCSPRRCGTTQASIAIRTRSPARKPDGGSRVPEVVEARSGLRMTLSKRGASVSGGPRGAKLSVNTRGERRASLGWFGTYWRKRI